MIDWYGNEDDKEALQRGFQGQGSLEAMRGDLTLAELATQAWRAPHDDRILESTGH